jgi:hypothetical protein
LFKAKCNLGDKANVRKSGSNLLWLYPAACKRGVLESFVKDVKLNDFSAWLLHLFWFGHSNYFV